MALDAKHSNIAERKTGRRPTSYDVAELAGVSQSAVSRVFQAGASASQEMRDRVTKAANQLGYRPNAIARGLITQRSDMVAVAIAQQVNLSYPEVLVQLTQQFSKRGIRVLLFALQNEGETDGVIDQVLRYRVDGLLAAVMLSSEQVDLITDAGVPLVFYNRKVESSASSVICDQAEGAKWLVDSMLNAGHRSFGIVRGSTDSPVGNERVATATSRLRERGVSNISFASGDFSYKSGKSAFAALLKDRGSAPDAVIAANDAMAIGCIDEARENFGLAVPDEISIAGFDGTGAAKLASYNLTTVRQPVKKMAETAVSMLIDRIENPELPPENRQFSGEPVAGASTRILRPESAAT